MGATGTIIVYSLVGLTTAVAHAIARPADSTLVSAARFPMQLALWPFFAPLLLGRAIDGHETPPETSTDHAPRNSANPRIQRLEHQLSEALDTVGGVASELLGEELENIRQLSKSLRKMNGRLEEMETLLASDEFDAQQAEQTLRELLDDPDIGDSDERIESVRARLRNIERLETMRDNTRHNLDRALLKMEEMISQILLLQFADQPEDQIAENIQQIASTIDGLSEVLPETRDR